VTAAITPAVAKRSGRGSSAVAGNAAALEAAGIPARATTTAAGMSIHPGGMQRHLRDSVAGCIDILPGFEQVRGK
jgi:hypothetical protein